MFFFFLIFLKLSDPHFWLAWTDEKEEGVFADAMTGKRLDQKSALAKWAPGEPNGERVENCVEEFDMFVDNWRWNDVSCQEKQWFIFKFSDYPVFQLRGDFSGKSTCLIGEKCFTRSV